MRLFAVLRTQLTIFLVRFHIYYSAYSVLCVKSPNKTMVVLDISISISKSAKYYMSCNVFFFFLLLLKFNLLRLK